MTRIPTGGPAGSEDAPSLAEIEITPEMIKAALDEFWRYGDHPDPHCMGEEWMGLILREALKHMRNPKSV